ncbi:MAG: class I SAM-dependent methyltransferase [Chitinophagaceae bacterium]|nr:class I SAM-dependent methyltransferase [Chitinophagaceae bacterium]
MVHYSSCPVCGSNEIEIFLQAKDYTVSGKFFPVIQCKKCTAAFTNNIPAPNEIGAYYKSENYISHSDTAQGLVNKLYHKVRNITLVSKKNMVTRFTQKTTGTILDIGCGTAAFLHTMKSAGWQITGLEPDNTAREKAQSLYQIAPLSSENFKTLPANSFDAITLWHVLEHVHDLQGYLQQIKILLKPAGKLFVAVPNYTSYDAKKYGLYWAAYDVPRHLYHFSPSSISVLIQAHQLKVVAVKPMWFDSFYVSMLSEKYKTGNTNLISAFLTGFISNVKAFMNTQKCSSVIYIIEHENNPVLI